MIIDGGNSLFTDTNRRCQELKEKGIIFIGTGISGGEEGARHGPSIMPGGNPDGWPRIKAYFSEPLPLKLNGEPCCDWVGDEGAGHYVKMVHNGIEYGDMQLICEAYDLLKNGLGLKANQLSEIFKDWNQQELNSYLIEITSHIFSTLDTDNTPLSTKSSMLPDKKGLASGPCINALDLGMPLTLIGEAVFARCLSAIKEERMEASKVLKGPENKFKGNVENSSRALGRPFMLQRSSVMPKGLC